MPGWRRAAALLPRTAAAAEGLALQQQLNSLLPAAAQPGTAAWGAGAALLPPAWPPAAPAHRRAFGSAAAACAPLGIVEQLRCAGTAEAAAAAAQQLRWEVVEFRRDGRAQEITASPESLGLHPRDVYLFDTEAAAGLGSGSLLAPRPGHFVFITPSCRAVVAPDRAVLWPGPRKAETVKTAQAMRDFTAAQSGSPFELRILEALLSETVREYTTAARRLAIIADTVLADMGVGGGLAGQATTGELHRLIPIERQLTHMQNELKDVTHAISQVADNSSTTRKLCLTQAARTMASSAAAGGRGGAAGGAAGLAAAVDDDSSLASAMLKSYEAKLHRAQLVVREALASIEQMRLSWHMTMDHQRNRVLRLNLFVGVMSLCTAIAVAPSAFLGMNLHSGLEQVEGLFWLTVQASLGVGGALAGGMWMYYRVGPKWRYAQRMRDIDSLRDLLVHHLSDLGDVMAAAKHHLRSAPNAMLSKAEFATLVQDTVRSAQPMSRREVELLYRVLDADADGMLELSDMERLETRIQSQLGGSRAEES